MDNTAENITERLNVKEKSEQDIEDLFRLIERQFRKVAYNLLRVEYHQVDLQQTMLVNDAFRTLVLGENVVWENKAQFFCAAAKVMRRLIVDHARGMNAVRRGKGERSAPLEAVPEPIHPKANDPQMLVEINDLLANLEEQHPDAFRVFDLRFFGGFEWQEIADNILEQSKSTVKRRWELARAFLSRELTKEQSDHA